MLKEDDLIECVQDSLKGHIENVASLDSLLSSISQERINRELAQEYAGQIRANEKQLAQIEGFKTKLYENLVSGILTKEEYLSYKRKYNADIELLQKAVAELGGTADRCIGKPQRAEPLDQSLHAVFRRWRKLTAAQSCSLSAVFA